ncbi:DNA methylase [Candidatus Anstonella stagnisolia]|nr:DNA methylase [Candidatus Anstonella stagnisolia]
MAKKPNYEGWSEKDYQEEIDSLRKQKTYGLIWEKDKTKEVFDYYLNWDGIQNKEVFKEAEAKFPVLKEVNDRTITTDKNADYNILIEGDNYHALATLNFTHANNIDLIYIDPPYNTGNKDFKYNDRWVDREDAYRHSKWLSFMEKRLRLAKTLLKETGVIFMSINDNELAQLKILSDEVFGEKNFIGNFIWRKKEGGGQADAYFVTEHEYVLVYRKSDRFEWLDEIIPTDEQGFNKEDERGKFTLVKLAKWGNAARREDRPKMYFAIKAPDGKNIFPKAPDGNEGRWRVGKARMEEIIKENLVQWINKNNEWLAYEKVYYDSEEVKKIKERSILYGLAGTADGTNQLTAVFGKKDIFPNPKPKELIKFLVSHGIEDGGVVLDFFAGSGTTGHAVLELNKEDGGNRRFILCTNDEGNICTEVCYPRIEKVIKGYKPPDGEKIEGLGSNLRYFKTDFVDSAPTAKNKKRIVNKSTEMICLKENAFNLIKDGGQFKIFKNSKTYIGIVFESEEIDAFVKEAKKIDGKFNVYVFSLDDTVPEKEFKELKGRVSLCPIPEAILHVYRRVFKDDDA